MTTKLTKAVGGVHQPLVVPTTDEEESVDSLLSDWNSDSEDDDDDDDDVEEDDTEDSDDEDSNSRENATQANKNTSGDGTSAAYQQLQQKFALREALLKRMCKGKDESYTTMLMHHEALVQAEAFRQLTTNEEDTKVEGGKEKGKNDTVNKTKTTADTPAQIAPQAPSSLRNRLLFEARLTFPGLAALILYCSMHLAAYEVTQCIVLELTRIVTNEMLFYAGVCIAVPLLLTRLTGGVFDWVSVERHELAKFDLHNRIRLGYADAKLHLWFRKHKMVKFCLDTVSLYVCLVGVAYFHYRILSPFFSNRDWLLDNLPSREHGVKTPIYWWLKGRYTPECDGDDETEECSWLDEMTSEDERYVWSKVAVVSYHQFMGNEAAAGLTPWALQVLHVSIAGVAVFLLSKLGYTWH